MNKEIKKKSDKYFSTEESILGLRIEYIKPENKLDSRQQGFDTRRK